MARRRPSYRRRSLLIAAAGASLALFLGKKTWDFGAAPSAPKACGFAFPDAPGEVVGFDPGDTRLAFSQEAGFINDASCLNRTAVAGIVEIRSYDDVATALRLARDRGWKVSAAGCRHTMGGQSFAPGNLVLDMRRLNAIEIDKPGRTMTVQAGAIWSDILRRLDSQGLAAVAMPSFSKFTIGGTLSVNAHGTAHDPGSMASTVRAIRVMLWDGRILQASPDENVELFRHVIGGYGLFGVVLDAAFDLTENRLYQRDIAYVDYRAIPDLFADIQGAGDRVAMFYGRFSVAQSDYLRTVGLHRFLRSQDRQAPPPLQPEGHIWLKRLTLNVSKIGRLGRWLRWQLERELEPRLAACLSRNAAMDEPEACLVARNQEMLDSGAYLENRLPDTDILQEYFLPPGQVPAFIDGLRAVVVDSGVNLLNLTMRIVQRDTVTALPYAPDERVALVLYFNQALDRIDSDRLWQATAQLIELATGLGGRFYLPYQLAYSPQQLLRAYPEIAAFFAAKRRYDPAGPFSNKLFEKYGIALG